MPAIKNAGNTSRSIGLLRNTETIETIDKMPYIFHEISKTIRAALSFFLKMLKMYISQRDKHAIAIKLLIENENVLIK